MRGETATPSSSVRSSTSSRTKRDARVQELQDLLDRARALIEARAIELKDIPGGETGLLCRDLKGRNADQPVYKADVPLIAEIRGIMRQAAEELGQWVEKREETVRSASSWRS